MRVHPDEVAPSIRTGLLHVRGLLKLSIEQEPRVSYIVALQSFEKELYAHPDVSLALLPQEYFPVLVLKSQEGIPDVVYEPLQD